MSVNIANLFTELGHLGGLVNNLNTYVGTTVPGKISQIVTDFAGTFPQVVDGIFTNLGAFQSSPSAMISQLQGYFQNAITTEIDAEAPLSSKTLPAALQQLITEMIAGGFFFAPATVSSAVTAGGSNNGNGAICIGLKANSGRQLDLVFNETILGTVSGDAQSGSATLNQELITFAGQIAAPSSLNFAYPLGSGVSNTVTCVTANVYNGNGNNNYLFDGDFEQAWVGSVPPGWHVTVGAGQISRSTTAGTFYDGVASLQITGDSSTLTAFQTQFKVDFPGDTVPVGILPATQYCFNMWLKVSSVPAAGVLEVALVNGSGTILQDIQGVNSSVTFALTGATTSFQAFNGMLRTPRVMPSQVFLRIRLSTALSTGSNLFLDRVSLCQPTSLYASGPRLAAFSGNVPFIISDTESVAVNNNYANAWQILMDRMVNLKQLGLLFPTAGSTAINPALIV